MTVADDATLVLDGCDSLAEVEGRTDLRVLMLRHFPKVRSLEPLAGLSRLEELVLHTTPGWDGSGKDLVVETFAPLAHLHELRKISILGVVPERDRLEPLHGLSTLRDVTIGNTSFYQLEDFAALARALPEARGIAPVDEMNFTSYCNRCGGHRLLFLVGAKPRGRKYVCPGCNRKLILRHLQRWNEAGGTPRYDGFEDKTPEALLEIFGRPETADT